MESVATMLIVLYRLFFGWCGGEPEPAPAPHCTVSER